jgi:Icc-related predicted phosphoesterase
MRIQVVSDVHCEFHRDGGRSFVESLDPDGVDVLVLAGDIAVGVGISGALELFCRRYSNAHVLYVHGNHEFYGTDRESVVALCREAEREHPNLRWLDVSSVEISGQRFLGAPLWFPPSPEGIRFKHAMTDFAVIRDFESWVYDANARAVALLEKELGEGDVVVTHHLPSFASVAPRFVGNPLNPFFVCNMEPLIRERRPRLWIHGHTHCSMGYVIGSTTIACNPFGYVGTELNPDFLDKLVFEL